MMSHLGHLATRKKDSPPGHSAMRPDAPGAVGLEGNLRSHQPRVDGVPANYGLPGIATGGHTASPPRILK